ncbi:MFS transporter [Amycolatopsis sp.]|uniref:MFS transporter n=1 Tax=Amycolatopsis sp. TaxID=37632 RepID=UPI002C4C77FF|nr:MFS transporter [Amycolatopsis sp.]HVV08911.1 MFS transporter [Amycolatopsis sp.]
MAVRAETRSRFYASVTVLSAANFLVVFDGLVVTVALPRIQAEFALPGVDAQWALTAFALALGGTLVVAGRSGDRFGRRRLLRIGLLVLAGGSLLSGCAPVWPVLLAARVVQGAGAGLAVPNAFAIISATAAAPLRNRLFAAVACGGGIGVVGGALAGGVITQNLGWRWVFLLPIPFALAVVLVAPQVLPDERGLRRGRIDVLSGVLLTAGIALSIVAMTELGHGRAGGVWLPLSVAMAVLVVFVARERRAAEPLLDRALVRRVSLRVAMIGMLGQEFAYQGTVFVGLLLCQQVLGFPPGAAGLVFAIEGVAVFAGSRFAPVLLRRWPWPGVVAGAQTCCAAGLFVLALVPVGAGYVFAFLPGVVLVGAASAVSSVSCNAAAGSGAALSAKGGSYGLYETSKYLSGTLAVASFATVAALGAQSWSVAGGYRLAFALAAVVAGLAGVRAGTRARR